MTITRLGVFATHPIQYHSPWYRHLAVRPELDVNVYYFHRQTAGGQAAAGFGVQFEWDVPLLDGYPHKFLTNVSRRPSTDTYDGCDTPEVSEVIRRERFDAVLVHGWYTKSYMQVIRECWRTKTPILVRGDSHLLTPRSWMKKWAKELYYRLFVPRFDACLAVGVRSREYFLHYGAKPERVIFCPHFVDNDRFARTAAVARVDRVRLREKWGLPSNAVVVLFAGKFIAKKRPLDFVRAVVAAQDTNMFGLMVGDGPLREELESVVRTETALVRFAGFLNQSEIPQAYAAADAIVLPSDGGETWGLVVNEAMASGLPVIVSDKVGCAPDLVTPGQTGWSYPCGDTESLAKIMKEVATQTEVRGKLGLTAQRHVEKYSVSAATDGLFAALSLLPRRVS